MFFPAVRKEEFKAIPKERPKPTMRTVKEKYPNLFADWKQDTKDLYKKMF